MKEAAKEVSEYEYHDPYGCEGCAKAIHGGGPACPIHMVKVSKTLS